MKNFIYSAVDDDGLPQSGTMRALSRQQAVNTLKAKNYIVTNLEEKNTPEIADYIQKIRGVPREEVVVFTRQLGTMIGAGLPINQALRILGNQTTSPYFSEIITDTIQQIDGGASLHDAIATHEKEFGRLYLSLIQAGESSGNLETILSRLADTMESDATFRGKVKGAMIYPMIIVIVMFGVLGIMFLFVIPQLAQMYEDMDADLPTITKMMIGFSDFLVSFWWLMILFTVGLFFGLKKLVKIPKVSYKLAKMMLKIPVFGALSVEIQLTSFTRTLSMLVSSGIPLIEALDISKETLSNVIFRQAVTEATGMVEKGKPLAEAFRRYKEFPPLLSEMVSVGEQTGKVDEVLGKISTYFEERAGRKTENLASAIEPIVMVLLGVMVAFIVVSLILPIYSLTSQF